MEVTAPLERAVTRFTTRPVPAETLKAKAIIDVSDEQELDYPLLIQRMREEVEVKDRTWVGKTYKGCFLGKDAVTWIVDNTNISSRSEAEKLGNRLMTRQVFQHCEDGHPFADCGYYYRFKDTTGQFLATLDGENLFYRFWKPLAKPKSLVIYVHALGEHCSRFDEYFRLLTQAGIIIAAFDFRGHGNSTGKRGHATIEQLQGDLDTFMSFVSQKHPDLPTFIYGHSFGGAVSLLLCIEKGTDALPSTFKGIITSSTLIRPNVAVNEAKKFFGRLFQPLAPRVRVDNGVVPGDISRDPTNVLHWIQDPLVHSQISLTLGAELLDSGPKLLSIANKLTLPLLLIHGEADKIASPEGAEEFFQSVSSRDKTIKIWKEVYHDMEREPESEEIAQYVIDWMERHY